MDALIFSPVRINLLETRSIVCVAGGNPVATVRIEDPNSVVLQSNFFSLIYTFKSVTYDRAGNYRCIANNTIDSIEQIRVLPFEVIIQGRLLKLNIIYI